MSEQESSENPARIQQDSREGNQTHQPGASGVQPGVQQPLTPEAIGNAIKQALGGFRTYLDSSLERVKEESDQKIAAAAQELKKSTELNFRYKGHKRQFEFNSGVIEGLEKAVKALEQNNSARAVTLIGDQVKELKTRNKHIRIADKSDAG